MKKLLLVLLSACAPAWPYSTMASHTVRVAADKDTDVVWVQHIDGKLYRCANFNEGPVCTTVRKQ